MFEHQNHAPTSLANLQLAPACVLVSMSMSTPTAAATAATAATGGGGGGGAGAGAGAGSGPHLGLATAAVATSVTMASATVTKGGSGDGSGNADGVVLLYEGLIPVHMEVAGGPAAGIKQLHMRTRSEPQVVQQCNTYTHNNRTQADSD